MKQKSNLFRISKNISPQLQKQFTMKFYHFPLVLLIAGILSLSFKSNDDSIYFNDAIDDTIVVVKKDTFAVELESNPSTGYKWVYKSNDKKVELVSENFKSSETEKVGSPGTQTILFYAKKKGTVVLDFEYVRRNSEPAKKHTVIIVINKK